MKKKLIELHGLVAKVGGTLAVAIVIRKISKRDLREIQVDLQRAVDIVVDILESA